MRQPANRLARETSPYLLQHAHNPVDWYPWGPEAFEKARREDKPIIVSIGYAACHWCHVMERESFENEATAALMNEHFVNIKVDREERPDVDHIYMDAVQVISGSGGWPLNVFLTPEGKPFYGGTYFPPRRAFNRASWTEVLQAIAQTYREGRDQIEEDATRLTEHLQASNALGIAPVGAGVFEQAQLDTAYQNIMKTADRQWGGFGRAPKFPQTFTINFLLRYAYFTGREEARQQALLSLDKMMQGGIYDHVGGGFARYATDTEWLVPHFEKMLYDNALLVMSLSEAYQLTGEEKYREVVEETLQFTEREMRHAEGGFYSALDADSEGEEGRFYVWDFEEVQAVLGAEAELFCRYFNITPGGNWEGKNILFVTTPLRQFVQQHQLDERQFKKTIQTGRQKLLQKRSERVRPQLDDKVLLSWNALMNIAFSKACAATGNQHYKEVAVRNMNFILSAFQAEGELLHHTWKGGQAKYPAFLDDYSYLIAALLELAQVTADYTLLEKARALTQTVLDGFADTESSLFYFTHASQTDVLLRKKEVYDAATPSGNAVMSRNLYQLSILLDLPAWREKAEAMVASFGEIVVKYPTSFGQWLNVLHEMTNGTDEIAIVGNEWLAFLQEILSLYKPHKLIMAQPKSTDQFPLLRQREGRAETRIYLCKNYVCQKPVNTIAEFKTL